MKTLFLTVATTALILAAPTAFAADDHHDHGPGDNGKHTEHMAPVHTDHMAAPSHTMSGPAMSGPAHDNMQGHKGTTMSGPTPPKGWTVVGHGKQGNNGNNAVNNPHNGNDDRGNNGYSGGNDHRAGNNGHGKIDFHRHNVTASHHFHYRGGNYRWPHGYHYQRWSFGMTLPSIFWGRDYWIDDYSDYGLAYPPPGCVWVRYGDDAILIDEYTGEILEVVYGQFD